MMHQRIGKKKKLVFFYIFVFILLSTQFNKNMIFENKFYNNQNDIQVFGLSENENFKIFTSLNSLTYENIFLIKKNIFYNILKDNNLIESFYVKKIYPNKIEVNMITTKDSGIRKLKNQ